MNPVIDSHCHIYPDKIAEKASEGIGKFYDTPMKFDGRLSTLKEVSARAHVCHSVVFSVATAQKQVSSINNYIASCVSESEGRMTGLGTLYPDSDDLDRDIEQIISLGLKGVKLHPDVQGFKIDDYRCLKIYEKCEGRLPVLLHCGDYRYDFSNTNRLIPILETYENLTVIGAHFGGWSNWEKAAEELCGYKNLIVDSSSTFAWVNKETAKKLIKLYGADKIMFAADYPMWDPKDEIEYLLSLGLTNEEYEKIFYKNAQKLFDIKL